MAILPTSDSFLRKRFDGVSSKVIAEWAVGDDRSVKIKSLEAAKIMKIKWLVLGCIEADFCK